MTSKLKVNLINDAGDNNIITSDGSGNVTLGNSFPSVGKIGQVVNTVNTTEYATTSGTYSDITGLTLNITPSATTSKILVLMQMTNRAHNGSGTNANAEVKLLRDSTDLQEMSYFAQLTIGNGNPDSLIHSGSHIYLDSPSTTSQITYKYQGKTNSNFRAFVKNLTLMEVLA